MLLPQMTPWTILLIAATNFLIGLFVLLRNPKRSINLVFFLVTLTFGIWDLCLLFYEIPLVFSSLFWIRMTYFFSSLFMALTFLFSFIFPKSTATAPWTAFLAIGLYELFVSYLLFFTDQWVVTVFVDEVKGLQTTLGSLYPLWVLVSWTVVVWAAFNFLRSMRMASGRHAVQLRYLMVGFLLWGVAVNVPDVIIPLVFNDTRYFALSTVSSLFFSVPVAYVIIKHRFLDIRLVLARSVAYLLFVLTMGSIYAGGLFFTTTFIMGETTATGTIISSTALALFIAFTFQPILRLFEQVSNNIFYKDRYDTDTLLYAASQIMASTRELEVLTQNVLALICHKMHIVSATVYVLDEKRVFLTNTVPKEAKSYSLSQTELSIFLKQSKLLVFEELAEGDLKGLFRRYNISISLPLETKNGKVGCVLFAEKTSGEMYYSNDLRTLEMMAPEFAVGLENALGYEKIKRFNITLQEEVAKATSNLRIANERLKELDRLKDEFLSIASHDLRTPMTAIKGYLWLILKHKSELSPTIVEHLTRIYNSSERMIALVNDMLDVSRIEAGRMQLSAETLNLAEEVAAVKEELASQADEKHIAITVQGEPPSAALADRNRLHEVLVNLLGNAIKFTPPGGKITISFSPKDGMVATSVTDTGIGIAPENINKLFTKFGRIETTSPTFSQVPGTGLGLYISRKIVELSGGQIWAESSLGKGSTFTFTLPRANGPLPKTS